MRRLYYLIIVTLVLLIGLGYNSSRALVWEETDQIAYCSENLLRLHILANSSSPHDQYLKRQVRDLIITETRKIFADVDNSTIAIEVTSTHLSALQQKIQEFLHSQGSNIAVKLELGYFDFPMRTYGNVTLPSGEYRALKVYLGEAQGNNWWCVLFPPLCLDNEEQFQETNPGQMLTLAFSKDEPEFEVEYQFKFLKALGEVPQWVKDNYKNLLKLAVLGSNGVSLLDE